MEMMLMMIVKMKSPVFALWNMLKNHKLKQIVILLNQINYEIFFFTQLVKN